MKIKTNNYYFISKTINYDFVLTDIVINLKNNLANIDNFTTDNLGPVLKEFSKSNNIIYSHLMKMLRNIISGLKASKITMTLFVLF